MLNMKTVDDRPIAVDWAVAKSKYETAGHAGDTPQPAGARKSGLIMLI